MIERADGLLHLLQIFGSSERGDLERTDAEHGEQGLGERLMQPQFGCGIHDLLFAPNNAATRTRAVEHVRRALVAYEPRIDVLNVAAETTVAEPSLLLIRVDYRIRANNAVGNLVYPFYITEAA